ncbi:neuronal pentraxin-2-like [Branchiostoma floridae x Branchiostoma belcheri]
MHKQLFNPGSSAVPGDSQKIILPSPRSIENYARMQTTLSNDLRSFTLCVHMRSSMSTSDTMVLLHINQHHNNYLADPPVWDGEWHTICTTWRSSDGAWQLYADGVLTASGSGFRVGGAVRTGGVFILGQEQDTLGGGFDANQSFSGELSGVNLWDRVLSPAEIGAGWAVFCNHHGNVIDWDTTDIAVFGETSMTEYQCGK